MISFPSILDHSIGVLGLSKRVENHLLYEGKPLVRDLVHTTAQELLAMRGMGKTGLREIRSRLREHGLSLKGDAP